jgi:lauroyl/myristoyl acyltransferase
VRIAKRHRPVARRPLFTRQDSRFLLELPLLAAIATFVPETRWRSICVGLERLKARLGWFSPGRIRDGLTLMRGPATAGDDALRVAAARSEHHLQILREFFWGWSAPLELEGAEHLAEALRAGRGAVLWVAHFSFNSLAAKKALHQAGFAVAHLSRPEHGFSTSRFGIAVLNPIRVRTERRFLAERIIVERARPSTAMRRAQRQLLDNRLVSITAGAWEGALLATVAVGGVELELSTGAPGLAHVVGAPLLPVFTVRDEDTLRIAVIVGPPIDVDRVVERKRAVADAAQRFADRLAPVVARYPLQWRDWEKLRQPTGPPA